ncbi:MAG: SDR family oxidoreductase [Gammaproteobacteria bacterium]|nr:SDR family oxidoreductase [Gammaproteobacteria bacterium]MBU1479126.1 SDR family oxidoreductase [Gammaproteobacteria bacterium]MBU2003078.1 SDR family oxidoreductase [Gammaproteobacteria bacterium]MBU2134274.1 SDR family oxidoreductase [Gammaproteobacteria bacterium]MBU2187178.1 SDR family oxidoreductase [Gammaproteobacteria bacterium]
MSLYTVFGGRGFIGSEIVKQLHQLGHDVFVPERDDVSIYHKDLGRVIYCAGNGDCKNEPFSVLEANVTLLSSLLKRASFKRLLYMSSTRVYMNQEDSNESADLTVCVDDNRRLFNLTKLVAEELCLKSERNVCIVRPSNVYGVALNSSLFLPAITRNAIKSGFIDMYISQDYSKDYISVENVAEYCIKLSDNGDFEGGIINLASGYNVTALQLADCLQKYTFCDIKWHLMSSSNAKETFSPVDISLLKELFPGYVPSNVLHDLKLMIESYKIEMSKVC